MQILMMYFSRRFAAIEIAKLIKQVQLNMLKYFFEFKKKIKFVY